MFFFPLTQNLFMLNTRKKLGLFMGFKFPENRSDLPSTSCLNNTFNCKIRQGYKFFCSAYKRTCYCLLYRDITLSAQAWASAFSAGERMDRGFLSLWVCVCVFVCEHIDLNKEFVALMTLAQGQYKDWGLRAFSKFPSGITAGILNAAHVRACVRACVCVEVLPDPV